MAEILAPDHIYPMSQQTDQCIHLPMSTNNRLSFYSSRKDTEWNLPPNALYPLPSPSKESGYGSGGYHYKSMERETDSPYSTFQSSSSSGSSTWSTKKSRQPFMGSYAKCYYNTPGILLKKNANDYEPIYSYPLKVPHIKTSASMVNLKHPELHCNTPQNTNKHLNRQTHRRSKSSVTPQDVEYFNKINQTHIQPQVTEHASKRGQLPSDRRYTQPVSSKEVEEAMDIYNLSYPVIAPLMKKCQEFMSNNDIYTARPVRPQSCMSEPMNTTRVSRKCCVREDNSCYTV